MDILGIRSDRTSDRSLPFGPFRLRVVLKPCSRKTEIVSLDKIHFGLLQNPQRFLIFDIFGNGFHSKFLAQPGQVPDERRSVREWERFWMNAPSILT